MKFLSGKRTNFYIRFNYINVLALTNLCLLEMGNDHEVEFHEIKIAIFHEIKIMIMRSKLYLFMRSKLTIIFSQY